MIYALIAIGVLALDFLTKLVVKLNMSVGERIGIIDGVFSLTYIRNRGMAWGLFEDNRWIFIGLTVIIIAVLAVIVIKKGSIHPTANLGIALLMSGAVGNMIDRIFYPEGVIDFICAEFIDFPIFNVADISVCVGAALIMIYIIFFDKNKEAD